MSRLFPCYPPRPLKDDVISLPASHSFSNSSLRLLAVRELASQRQKRTFSGIGFSFEAMSALTRTKADMWHHGCVNTAQWSCSGDILYTGSDDCTVKLWSLGDVDKAYLRHTVRTLHRGNIFSLDISREVPDMIVTAAMDGTVRTNHLQSANTGTTLHTSDDIIHMAKFDHEQPHVLYTAEQNGNITRIDFRTQFKEVIFSNCKEAYSMTSCLSSAFTQPIWRTPRPVKAIIQNPYNSSPHLFVGGQGFAVGLIDLRALVRQRTTVREGNTEREHVVNPFVKLWSPLFDCTLDSEYQRGLARQYCALSATHTYCPQDFSCGGEKVSHEVNTIVREARSEVIQNSTRVSVSGMQLSKDGERLLVNFQSDQIYTFPTRSPGAAMTEGADCAIGGQLNHKTFLKEVSFAGPRDEYVMAGSDSGHMFLWESRPTTMRCRVGDDEQSEVLSTCCKLVSVHAADSMTCNGVAVHPFAPIFASFGIEHDVKIWATQRGVESEHTEKEKDNSHVAIVIGDRSNRSLPISLPIRHSVYHKIDDNSMQFLPTLLTKNQMACQDGSILRMFDFNDHVFNTRLHFMADHVLGYGKHRALLSLQQRAYFERDVAPFAPEDARFFIMEHGRLLCEQGPVDVFAALLKTKEHLFDLPNDHIKLFNALKAIFHAHMVDKNKYHMPFRDYSAQKDMKLSLRFANFMLLSLLEIMRVANIAKQIGNSAFRNKDFTIAHYFYCKSFRYLQLAMGFKLIDEGKWSEVQREADSILFPNSTIPFNEKNVGVGDRAFAELFGLPLSVFASGQWPAQYEAEHKLWIKLWSCIPLCLEQFCSRVIPEQFGIVFSNIAATLVALEKFSDALHTCDDAIEMLSAHKLTPDAKLLFRRGSCFLALNNPEEAVECLQQAQSLLPKDAGIANKLKEAKRIHELKRKREIKAYSKMFKNEES